MSKLNIYACSGIGAVNRAQRVAQNLKDNGWMRNETLRKYLGTSNDGGCAEYFLYIFIPERDLAKYNATIYRKRQGQLKTYQYVRELFVGHGYGTEQEMLDIIRDGIATTFGSPVETILEEIRTGKREDIGDPLTIALAIISAILPLIIAVVQGIIEYARSVKVAKYTAPTFKEVEDSAPASSDFQKKKEKDGSGLLMWGALAGVALLVIGKFKRN